MPRTWIIFVALDWTATCIHLSMAQTTSNILQFRGDTIVLPCPLSGTFTFPEWRGPPGLIPYTIQDDASGAISPAAPADSRLEYANNNRDLILSDAAIGDSGDYTCAYTGLGDHTISLIVINPAITPLKNTLTSMLGSDETIPWEYDNAEYTTGVTWVYKSGSSETAAIIMDTNATAVAHVHKKFNVEHVTGGIITLKAVTYENVGIYYCTVTYKIGEELASITGTVTLEINGCLGFGNSTAVNSIAKCAGVWFGICFVILFVVLLVTGIVLGKMLICSCKDCVNYDYCRCECCAPTPCGACCNIKGLPSWYQVLWATGVCFPVALGIWFVWKVCGKADQPGGQDQTDNNELQMDINDTNQI